MPRAQEDPLIKGAPVVTTTRILRAAVCVAALAVGGIAAAQIQSGVARKATPPSVALGVPAANAKANASQRSSSLATAGSGSSLSFTSGQPALRYLPDDLPNAKDPVRREAVKDGAKDAGASARGAAPTVAGGAGEFAPAPGVLRANMPPVSFADLLNSSRRQMELQMRRRKLQRLRRFR
ncbi:MAG TPA: hypothetical protein VJ832_09905 [Variovorax sp.]|nr:hypothetical protein [Variovorax sp.]